jgi:hypothetical protein
MPSGMYVAEGGNFENFNLVVNITVDNNSCSEIDNNLVVNP